MNVQPSGKDFDIVSPTQIISASPDETIEFGAGLGAKLNSGDIVALAGELGAGKTVLAKGICRGIGWRGEVTSPSFVRIHTYVVSNVPFDTAKEDKNKMCQTRHLTPPAPPITGRLTPQLVPLDANNKSCQTGRLTPPMNSRLTALRIYHVDFYLLRTEDEVFDLGLDEIYSSEGIVIVEWAQRFPQLLPPDSRWIEISWQGEHGRLIRVLESFNQLGYG